MPQELTVFIAVDFLRTFFALVESRKDGLCKSLRHCLNHNPLKAKLNFTFPLDVCFQTKMNILLCQWECSLTFSALPATPSFGCGHNGKTKKQRLQKKKKKQFKIGGTIWKYFIFHDVLLPDLIKLLFLQLSLSVALPSNCPPLFYRYCRVIGAQQLSTGMAFTTNKQ